MSDKADNRIVLYTSNQGKVSIQVIYQNDTFWMTQKNMAELFGVEIPAINKHLKNIFQSCELSKDSVVSKMEITARDGKVYKTACYNLDAIIAVGYRVNSKEATAFRIWATKTLRDYIIKGFVLNEDMLKNGKPFGKDYFDELLEKIREIRASERRAYQKIADIFEQCSYDYDKNSETTKQFYAYVQNKLHFAITGKTAAQIIVERADSQHPTMGLTTWKNSPDGKILQSDTLIAKNYLNQEEIRKLNRLVNMFIDYAELQAEDGILMTMQNWLDETNRFLENNRRNVLEGSGNVSHTQAVSKAKSEYEVFRVRQDHDYISDFDQEIEKYLKGDDSSDTKWH